MPKDRMWKMTAGYLSGKFRGEGKVVQDFLDFVAGVFGVEPTEIDGDTSCQEYEKWDSMMHLRLVMEAEEQYGIEIPMEEVPNIRTLEDIYKYIEAKR